jgi:hypothetical protein
MWRDGLFGPDGQVEPPPLEFEAGGFLEAEPHQPMCLLQGCLKVTLAMWPMTATIVADLSYIRSLATPMTA